MQLAPVAEPVDTDADSAEAWLAHVELARDKFLLCCYTGLRISDADRVA